MRKILAACGFLLSVMIPLSVAEAAKCSVKEYTNITWSGGYQTQVASEPGTDQTPVDFSGGAAQSSAFASKTAYIRLICDAQAAFVFGTNPTATTNNSFVAAGMPEYFGVPVGQSYKISVVSRP